MFTDLYELTMAQAYWRSGATSEATFSLFFRKLPRDRGYFVFAGLNDVLGYLESFSFSRDDVGYLRSLNRFDVDFLGFLTDLRFTGSVRAMREGTIFFPGEPVLEVTAPVVEAQLVEIFLVNQVHLQTVLATKASRVVHAAQGRRVIDFAARRAHGTDAANKLARVSYMVGFDGTSNVMAGALYGLPAFGTMAHSFVTSFEDETESFRAFAAAFPDSTTLLVDTYDTLEGVRRALAVAEEMRCRGQRLRGVRLDSGDLLDLSQKARLMLDGSGFADVEITASGGLDEFEVERLLEAGAPIDTFAVGTRVGVSEDAPLADCAYKQVAYGGRAVMKLSEGKQTLPGPKQVFRRRNGDGSYRGDVVGRDDEPALTGAMPLLSEVMTNGRLRDPDPQPSLQELRTRFAADFAALPKSCKALREPAPSPLNVSPALDQLARETARAAGRQHRSPVLASRRTESP